MRGIDIALDPFPYTGGLTVCESLWMGVPVVALAGDSFCARHALSHLSNAGLADWVAADGEAYVAQAIARARDLPALDRLRQGLRARVAASPLVDAPRFGRNLAEALRQAWRAAPGRLSRPVSQNVLAAGPRCGNVLLTTGEAATPLRRNRRRPFAVRFPTVAPPPGGRRTRSAHDPTRYPPGGPPRGQALLGRALRQRPRANRRPCRPALAGRPDHPVHAGRSPTKWHAPI